MGQANTAEWTGVGKGWKRGGKGAYAGRIFENVRRNTGRNLRFRDVNPSDQPHCPGVVSLDTLANVTRSVCDISQSHRGLMVNEWVAGHVGSTRYRAGVADFILIPTMGFCREH